MPIIYLSRLKSKFVDSGPLKWTDKSVAIFSHLLLFFIDVNFFNVCNKSEQSYSLKAIWLHTLSMNLQLRLLKFFDCCKLAQPLTCQKSLTFGSINPQSTSSPTLGLSGNTRWYFKALFCTNLQFLNIKQLFYKMLLTLLCSCSICRLL